MGKSSSRGDINPGVIILVLGFSLSACGGEASDGTLDHMGSASEGIVNGEAVNPLGSALVYVTTPAGICSGVLMKNRAFMTAKHCVQSYVNSPSQVNAFMHPWASAADGIWIHDTKDVAVVRLAFPFPLYGVNDGRPIYWGSDDSLHNRSLMVAGYGYTTGCTGHGPFSSRRAFLTAFNDSTPGKVTTSPNALGQIGWLGDSGGPLLDGTSLTHAPLAGIQGSCAGFTCPNDPPDLCSYATPEVWGLWAFLILYNIPQF
jgi:hypothetical protein